MLGVCRGSLHAGCVEGVFMLGVEEDFCHVENDSMLSEMHHFQFI